MANCRQLLVDMTSLVSLKTHFQGIARYIHIELPTLNREERFDLITHLLTLRPLFPNDNALKQEFNGLFEQILLAPLINPSDEDDPDVGDMPLYLTSISLQSDMPKAKAEKELFHQLLSKQSEPYAYFFSDDQFFQAYIAQKRVRFTQISCVNAHYPYAALKKELMPEAPVLPKADTFTCVHPHLANDPEAIKRIMACTNTLSVQSVYDNDTGNYFTLDNSEKLSDPLQLNYQHQKKPTNSLAFY